MNRRELFTGIAAAALAPAELIAPEPVILQRLQDLEAYEAADAMAAFIQTMIRQVAASLAIPYEQLAREYEHAKP